MKNKIITLFSLIIFTSIFTSCDNGDDVAEVVQINKPTMTIVFPTAVAATEGTTIPVTFNLSAPVGREFNVYVVMDQTNSTANGEDSDIAEQTVNTTFQKLITIPAFVTTFSDVIEISEDDLTEGDEILKLNIGDTRTSAVNFQPVVSTITIKNVVADELVLDFNTNKTFTGSNGYSNNLCALKDVNGDGYDIDYFLWDAAFADTGNATAQTGNCVETMTIKLTDLPDGLYHVISALFTNAGLDQAIGQFPLIGAGDFSIPVSVDYLRSGSINKGTFVQEEANRYSASTPEGTLSQVVDVKISTVNGVRKFTVQSTDPTNPIISATGKMHNKAKYVSKHKN